MLIVGMPLGASIALAPLGAATAAILHEVTEDIFRRKRTYGLTQKECQGEPEASDFRAFRYGRQSPGPCFAPAGEIADRENGVVPPTGQQLFAHRPPTLFKSRTA